MPTAPLTYTVYKFISPYTHTYCVKMGGTGGVGCSETKQVTIEIGTSLTSMGNSISSDGQGNSVVTGQVAGEPLGGTATIPLSVLEKTGEFTGTPNQNQPVMPNWNKNIFTLKNVIIAIVLIVAVVAILKLFKVI